MSAEAPIPAPGSSTNSIEIFIDADGQVTFTDLPDELREVVETLAQFEVEPVSWCELYPTSPTLTRSPDTPDKPEQT